MRLLLSAISILVLTVVAFAGLIAWQYFRLFPGPSSEIVELTPGKRVLLQHLRDETKFQPHHYPPLGYTGAETREDEARATEAVHGVIDAVLARSDGPIDAKAVSALIARGMWKVFFLATEDRDRTQGYMIEIWYLLGFKGATGRFAYGSGYPMPDGYGEPLPPGWSAPEQPRILK